MTEDANRTKWWQTVPGILGGIAALIAAIGGLVGVILPLFDDSPKIEKTQQRASQPSETSININGNGNKATVDSIGVTQ